MSKKYVLGVCNIFLTLFLFLILILGFKMIGLFSNSDIILLCILYLLLFSFFMFSYLSKKVILYNVGQFVCMIINIVLCYQVYITNNNYEFISNFITDKYVYNDYAVFVKKKTTTYSDIKKLNGKKIGLLSDNSENVRVFIEGLINIDFITYESLADIYDALDSGEIQSFIINVDDYEINETKEDEYRVIYINKIKV